ncbi:transferase family hexapeptide repeat protein [Rhodovulum visakhapatnamense]|uniref:Transferase family hexapeptide repeat protein n=2 Tax=Rhodovulum visakhapatnamense TaxID=364297 RepID=A0A4R8FEE0_9RHOB|nr:transferase family hexapeptide repeat protein [Rhodovulum visakhapatnamense]
MVRLWKRLCRPSAEDWTAYLKRHGGFHRLGDNCFIMPDSVFTDPYLTSIGNNVWIVGAWVACHDGSAVMAGNALGKKFDTVAPVILHNDVFIGRGAIILPGVSIGPRAIVGAGAVVGKDVPPDTIVAGNPARKVRGFAEHAAKLSARTEGYPWKLLIESREGGYDPMIEPELRHMRVAYFFPED